MRQEKQLLLDDLSDKISASKGFIIAEYKGFSAAQARGFRNHMQEFGAEFEVVRKRVFVKAAEASGIEFNADKLQGHIGIIFANQDATETVKQTVKYSESNNNVIVPLAGHIEGAVCSQADIQALAKLPGLNELRAQLLGLLQAPMSQTVGVLQAVLASVMYCIEEKSKKD
jgi:large subunit ribosomal protein L10